MANETTLIQIRERAFLDILDLALVVVRSRPLALGIAAAVGVAPFAALNAWLTDYEGFPVGLLIPLLILETPWATAPLGVVLGGMMFGERPTAWQVVRTMVRAFPSMFLYQFLVRGALMVTMVLYPIVPTRLAFLDEVILLEQGRWWAAIRRSANLCGHRGGELFGQWLAQLMYGALFVVCFWVGTGKVIQALTSSELTWDEPGLSDVLGARFQFATWLAICFFGVARFFAYIDQRIRLEGWEVKLRLGNVARTMEGAQRW